MPIIYCFFTEMFRHLFKVVKYADQGSNARTREEQTYMYFIEFLEDCETGIYMYMYVHNSLLFPYFGRNVRGFSQTHNYNIIICMCTDCVHR